MSASPVNGSSESTCTFVGNSDLYGLGIRLGVYIQWVSSVLASNCSTTEATTMRTVNTCFQLATVTGLLAVVASHTDEIFEVEVLILLLLALGACSDYISNQRLGTSKEQIQILRLIDAVGSNNISDMIRMTVTATVCAFGVWFAFIGLDSIKHQPCKTHAFVFVFAKARLDGPYRTFIKVFLIVALVSFIVVVVLSSYLVYGRYIKIWRSWGAEVTEDIVEEKVLRVNKVQTAVSVLVCSFFIVSVELTINWNRITNVSNCRSFSQLFPLIVASANLLRLLYKIGVDIWRHKLVFT